MARLTTLLFAMWLGVTVSTVVDLEKRVFGGEECGPKERQYHVKLISRNTTHRSLCGGSLISNQWILTAAHCYIPGWNVNAYIGVHPITNQNFRRVEITAPPAIFNDINGQQHDLMLLQLPNPEQVIKPVRLPHCRHLPKIGAVVQVAGHAATTVGPNNELQRGSSKTLQCADMEITKCEVQRHEELICTSRAGVDTCKGDSGGGLVYKKRIYGLHVRGHPTHACGSPTVFMDLCYKPYLKWIKETIKYRKKKCCFG